MLYLIIAAEIRNGFRKLEDIPVEMRPTVEKILEDYKSTSPNKGDVENIIYRTA